MTDELLSCPFCKEPRFDLIGLKTHLQNHCDEYGKYESVLCIAARPTPAVSATVAEGLADEVRKAAEYCSENAAVWVGTHQTSLRTLLNRLADAFSPPTERK